MKTAVGPSPFGPPPLFDSGGFGFRAVSAGGSAALACTMGITRHSPLTAPMAKRSTTLSWHFSGCSSKTANWTRPVGWSPLGILCGGMNLSRESLVYAAFRVPGNPPGKTRALPSSKTRVPGNPPWSNTRKIGCLAILPGNCRSPVLRMGPHPSTSGIMVAVQCCLWGPTLRHPPAHAGTGFGQNPRIFGTTFVTSWAAVADGAPGATDVNNCAALGFQMLVS